MGARIRSFDWAATSIGPPERWPTALRVAINICLHSSLPTAIYWGPELRLIYNDAWAPIPAERHPSALGPPARAVWSDIWDLIEPQFEGVFRTAEGFSTLDPFLLMTRGRVPCAISCIVFFSPIRVHVGYGQGGFHPET